MGKNGQKTSANLWVGNLMMRSYGPGLWIICDGLPMPVGGVDNQKIEGHIIGEGPRGIGGDGLATQEHAPRHHSKEAGYFSKGQQALQ